MKEWRMAETEDRPNFSTRKSYLEVVRREGSTCGWTKTKRGRERRKGERNRVTGRDIEKKMWNGELGQTGNWLKKKKVVLWREPRDDLLDAEPCDSSFPAPSRKPIIKSNISFQGIFELDLYFSWTWYFAGMDRKAKRRPDFFGL